MPEILYPEDTSNFDSIEDDSDTDFEGVNDGFRNGEMGGDNGSGRHNNRFYEFTFRRFFEDVFNPSVPFSSSGNSLQRNAGKTDSSGDGAGGNVKGATPPNPVFV